MKMRYCFLISAITALILGGVLSIFIDILALSIVATVTSFVCIMLISLVIASKTYKESKVKLVIPISILGILAIWSMVFSFSYKGDVIVKQVSIIICGISFLAILFSAKLDKFINKS